MNAHISNNLSIDYREAKKTNSYLQRNPYEDCLLSYSSGSVRSNLLGKTMETTCCFIPSKIQSEYGGSASTETEKSQDPDSSFSQAAIPSPNVSNRLYSEHIKAKKARVESIVQGMNSSFNKEELCLQGHKKDIEQLADLEREGFRESKRKCQIPHQQNQSQTEPNRIDYEYHQLAEQQLRQLQGRLFQVYYLCDVEDKKAKDSAKRSVNCDINESHQNDFMWRRVSEMEPHKRLQEERGLGGNHGLSPQDKRLSEMLKRELSRAITHIVDSVMKKVLLTQSEHLAWMSQMLRPRSTLFGENRAELIPAAELSQKENLNRAEQQSMNETESPALAHITNRFCDTCSQPMKPRESYHIPQVPYLMSMQENKILTQLLEHKPSSSCIPSNTVDMPCRETVDQEWENIKVMSSVSSRNSMPTLQKKSRSRKSEHADLMSTVDGIHYTSATDGLSSGHLKKAKLMFFFTRYPSSNLLKNYFPDVKFSRCITSQLIKWFSNFREFYYMQIEKFARQASIEGIDPKDLMMSHDSDLFRALNMHYNKANDFQVPDVFFNTATVTLREFFSAVNTGKDLDPSWKKSIYKTISKLDSDIPEVFKSPTYPHGGH
nr:prospero homeobox protein 2 isoform X2 [Geotrypetes seraphini]